MTTPTPTLRELRWTDIPTLVAAEQELFGPHAWTAGTWWQELAARPSREYFVIDDGEQLLGYGGVHHGGEVADVMTLAVLPVAQGGGLGRVLLQEVQRRAIAGGAGHVLLEVRADNVTARSLYESAGFEQISVRPRYYQPGDIDALILRRHLTSTGRPKGV